MKRYYLGESFPNIYLSPLQAKCLACFMVGYSLSETSEILNLSERTLKALMIEMQKKLNCSSLNDLIEVGQNSKIKKYLPQLISHCSQETDN